VSEQVVDLRSTWATLRRRGGTLAAAAVVGAAAGVGLLYLNPPLYSSTGIVLLPANAAAGSADTAKYDAETQVLIAESAEVLGRAGRKVAPALSAAQVADRVVITAPAATVLRFTATGRTAAEAEALSSALAEAHVAYLREASTSLTRDRQAALQDRQATLTASLQAVEDEIRTTSDRLAVEGRVSPEGRADAATLSELTAQRAGTVLELDDLKKQLQGDGTTGSGPLAGPANVMQHASPAEHSDLVDRVLTFVPGSAGVALLVTVLYLLLTTRRDLKLRSRDEIADAVGVPVVASVASRPARSASGWTDLLHSYSPDNVDGWALRQLVRRVMSGEVGPGSGTDAPRTVVVICLSDDHGALATAPQLASFAASTGIDTALVGGQFHESAMALWAACSRPREEGPPRRGLTVTTRNDEPVEADLVVRLVVLDSDHPQPAPADATGATAVLAVSAGRTTASRLAEVMVVADAAGYFVEGVVVSDPDALDRTSGRLVPREPRNAPASATSVVEVKARQQQAPPSVRRGGSTARNRSRR
jgi:capsular polysaccharide biosynthesis protein